MRQRGPGPRLGTGQPRGLPLGHGALPLAHVRRHRALRRRRSERRRCVGWSVGWEPWWWCYVLLFERMADTKDKNMEADLDVSAENLSGFEVRFSLPPFCEEWRLSKSYQLTTVHVRVT